MFLDPSRAATRRDDNPPTSSTGRLVSIIVLSVFGVLLLFACSFYGLRYLRKQNPNKTYLPGSFLKKKWKNWSLRTRGKRTGTAHLEPISEAGRTPANFDAAAPNAVRTANGRNTTPIGGAGVDRNTSVRSIMTLPAYNATPKDNEQVLGRAGERDGIDIVVQFPDIAEAAEEERREEEMEALYQVRLARRTEIIAREERRRLRREARERGDTAALEELRQTGRGESSANLEAWRATHERVKERTRAVSTVSYKDLGVARHDGTRIRANSEESERPLLGDAEAMAAAERGDPRNSSTSFEAWENSAESPGWMRGQTGDGDEADLGAGLLGGQEPPHYDDISLGHGRDIPPGYVSAVGRTLSGRRTASGRGDPSLSAHSPLHRSISAPGPPPAPAPAQPAAERPLGLGLTLPSRSVSGPALPTTPLQAHQSDIAPASTAHPISRHVSMPPPTRIAVASPPSSSPSPPLAVPPERADTVTRRRNSINSLMGGAGRPASAEIPLSRTFVLHTPPSGGEAERRASRGSLGGLPRLLGGSGTGAGNVGASTPSIVVESATPVVGPRLGRGRGGLGWEGERGGR